MLKSVLVALYIIMPVAIMTTGKAPSLIFYVAIAACLALSWQQKPAAGRAVLIRHKTLIVCYFAPAVAVLISIVAHGRWSGSNFEEALRLSLGLPILMAALAHIGPRALQQAIWGICAAALAATVYVVYLAYPHFDRPPTAFYNAVGYGNLMLLLAVTALFSLPWRLTRRPRAEYVFKLATAALAFAGFIITQTRSGWLAIPVFALIGIILASRLRRPVRAAAILAAVLIAVAAAGAASDSLRARINAGYTEALSCHGAGSTSDNSVCIRFQLWRAAWRMFTENPATGLGDSGLFSEQLKTRALPDGIVSEFTAHNFGEPHNDMLRALSSFGVPGGLALLLVYFAPLWLFLKRLGRHNPSAARAAAAMGAAFCAGFAIFGLTELMFRGMRTVSFYTMFVALFMVLSDPEKYRHEPSAGS